MWISNSFKSRNFFFHIELNRAVCAQSFSHVWLCVILWTIACQTPLSMDFFQASRQEYWSEMPFPTPGDLSDPGIKPASLVSRLYHWVLSSLKKRGIALLQEWYLKESSDYLAYLSQPNKYLLSKDTQHTLKLMLRTALEMSVISVNVSIAPWLWMALLSLRGSCRFTDDAQQENGLMTHSEPEDGQLSGEKLERERTSL